MFKPKTYSATKLDIKNLPFAELAETCQADYENAQTYVDAWAEQYTKYKTWIYPQVLAHLGRWTPVRNEQGQFCGKRTVSHNCGSSLYERGIYFFAMSSSRYVTKQTSKEGIEYCGLVPIILSAFKKFQDIPYSAWSRETLKHIVDARLCATMLTEVPDYPRNLLVEWRQQGLTVKTGPKAGTVKSATSTFGLYGLPQTATFENQFGETVTVEGPGVLNKLSAMILCQTWCAHPQWRNKYMILSHSDWDSIPDPLIEEDPVNQTFENTTKPSKNRFPDLPWL